MSLADSKPGPGLDLGLGWLRRGRTRRHILPGLGLSLGITLFVLSLIVFLPTAAMVGDAATLGVGGLIRLLATSRVLGAFKVSLGCAALAALTSAVFGLLIAWVLVRTRFPFRRLADAMVDLPFALPTSVAGIALSTLYAPNGWLGSWLAPYGIRVSFTVIGVYVALTFVGLPFVVRSVQPVLQDLEAEQEEAAHMLGAGRLQIFSRVIFPAILPSLTAGFAMAFARGLGEYGSVIFISSNKPGVSEIVPLLIVNELEQFDFAGAAAIGTLMLVLSLVILCVIMLLQRLVRSSRHG
ncbi:sulfate ABC transporter permease subunit CysT [Acidisoma cellulosilytica]|uniref:Sulfate transport system permease protein CysT n=1 Tax=Acidisoma cellulosilyticum TaxID=2802395 RepID=A0A963Z5V3_9PROT|nr:sulfate ABC transporter permease subunit CysT [Acidisoma cellulosilyticum]MCB8883387.1 sulfate ABC transporter permease subunit CysT [Acidisoma cellulosilyticum]